MSGPEPAAWSVEVPTGYRVGGWEVTGGIATGSWGSVYDARLVDAGGDDLPARAALKFLPTGTVTTRQLGHLAAMAGREVRFHSGDGHDRLIRCYQTLVVEDPRTPALDGAAVIVMERARRSLADLLREHPGRPLPEAAVLVTQVCEGLAHMHQNGWIHGDLKPANVLLMDDGSVRLADFGLTAEIEGTHGYLPPIGSSGYLPPEYWTERLGERGIAVRTTADIWALGVLAYQAFTGEFPFAGGGQRAWALAAAEYAETGAELPFPDGVPAPWRAIIRDCLAPSHAQRSEHTAAELLARMREQPVPRRRRSRQRRLVAAGAAVLVLGGAATATTLTVRQHDSPSPTSSRFPGDDLLKHGVGIPEQYRGLIVAAGTACDAPGLNPPLIAAMLKVESDFDPNLSDPAKDEYGIARWTPSVLAGYLPGSPPPVPPKPPFPPEMSIPPMGRLLCFQAERLRTVPGDRGLLLAAAYRSSATSVVQAGGIAPKWRHYTDEVAKYRALYTP
ncbi:serine/threonine-protein kinase [Actinoplanes oblitus]|uniref:Serine/threonine-protein kinase n=1 Tax=Actinoplanes oblitus TaxID=3040509 RepID=A0ABY8W556_9ACTN|nr:serine/threonine-protein kinase [Actinoplanes oblitus]WIM92991.1 serine/threonine-protein kinase [Actinoplanes oblitus]